MDTTWQAVLPQQDAPGQRTLPPAFLVWSGKGGVGKSTIAANLSVSLALGGNRVGYLDADLHGPSAATLMGDGGRLRVVDGMIQPSERHGVRVVSTSLLADQRHPYIWRGALLKGALTQLIHDTDWGDSELLVVDLPPGTGDVHMQLLDQLTCLGAVVVTTPQDIAVADVRRSLRMLTDAGVPVLAVIENMSTATCPHCQHTFALLPGDAGAFVRAELPQARLFRVPMTQAAAAAAQAGVPLVCTPAGRAGEMGAAVARVADLARATLARAAADLIEEGVR